MRERDPRRVEEPDFSDEDLAIADQVWDQRRQEEARKAAGPAADPAEGPRAMTVFVERGEGVLTLRFVFVHEWINADGGQDIRPGQAAFGLSYDEWARAVEVEVDAEGVARVIRARSEPPGQDGRG